MSLNIDGRNFCRIKNSRESQESMLRQVKTLHAFKVGVEPNYKQLFIQCPCTQVKLTN